MQKHAIHDEAAGLGRHGQRWLQLLVWRRCRRCAVAVAAAAAVAVRVAVHVNRGGVCNGRRRGSRAFAVAVVAAAAAVAVRVGMRKGEDADEIHAKAQHCNFEEPVRVHLRRVQKPLQAIGLL